MPKGKPAKALPDLIEAQELMLTVLWQNGTTRREIAEMLTKLLPECPLTQSQITPLAARLGLGSHPSDQRDYTSPKSDKRKPKPKQDKPASTDPLLATEGKYAALTTYARTHGLTLTQTMQRYHRARAGVR